MMIKEEEENIQKAIKAWTLADNLFSEEQIKALQLQVNESSMKPEIKDIDPDSWYNIPLCLVKACKVMLDQFQLFEFRLNNFTVLH